MSLDWPLGRSAGCRSLERRKQRRLSGLLSSLEALCVGFFRHGRVRLSLAISEPLRLFHLRQKFFETKGCYRVGLAAEFQRQRTPFPPPQMVRAPGQSAPSWLNCIRFGNNTLNGVTAVVPKTDAIRTARRRIHHHGANLRQQEKHALP